MLENRDGKESFLRAATSRIARAQIRVMVAAAE
jgi:hypothetical protein